MPPAASTPACCTAGPQLALQHAPLGNKCLPQPLSTTKVCIEAAALDKASEQARAVRNWKQPGAKRAGDFAAVMKDVSGAGCVLDGFGLLVC